MNNDIDPTCIELTDDSITIQILSPVFWRSVGKNQQLASRGIIAIAKQFTGRDFDRYIVSKQPEHCTFKIEWDVDWLDER